MDASPLPFSGAAAPITDADLKAAATSLAVDVATVEAVLTVETGGAGGFLTDGSKRPRILYEAHIFGRITGGRYNASHPDISRSAWTPGLYLGGAAEYGRLQRAVELDRPAALQAASWGLFQILGQNFKAAGFTNIEAFVTAMATGEGAHLAAFVAFVKANSLASYLRAKDWDGFAARYNGPGYAANAYDVKLAKAYAAAAARRGATAAPAEEAMPLLLVGSRGPAVQRLQRALRSREAHLSIDGIFGRATEAAVIRLQRDNRLSTDGIVGPATWPAIIALERPMPTTQGDE